MKNGSLQNICYNSEFHANSNHQVTRYFDLAIGCSCNGGAAVVRCCTCWLELSKAVVISLPNHVSCLDDWNSGILAPPLQRSTCSMKMEPCACTQPSVVCSCHAVDQPHIPALANINKFFPPLSSFEPPYPIAPDCFLPNSIVLKEMRKSLQDQQAAEEWKLKPLTEEQLAALPVKKLVCFSSSMYKYLSE